MKRTLIIVIAFALLASACGGKSKTAASSPKTTPAPPAATTTTGTAIPDCNAVGINPTGMHEGTCSHAGVTWVIVDENHTLKLSTLWAQLAAIRASKTLIGGGTTMSASGDFVIASVRITNKLPSPQAFDAANTRQADLILGGTIFKEASSAESGADPGSCLKRNGTPLQPSTSVTCDVVFEVPTLAASELGKHGSGDLFVVNFGSDLSGGQYPQTIGQIRLYR
jgi:hypothetical protein